MVMKKHLIAAALSLGLLASACIGPNNAFKGVYQWNDGVSESKWVLEGVHLAFWIIPVYPLALVGDLLVFNSIEFWGGTNPINEPGTSSSVRARRRRPRS